MLIFGVQLDLTLLPGHGDDALGAFQLLVRDWNQRRMAKPYATERNFAHDEASYSADGARVWEFVACQSADGGGTWQTEVRAHATDNSPRELSLTVAMRAETGTVTLSPTRYYVETPRFFRDLHSRFGVRVGGSSLAASPRHVATNEDLDWLLGELASPARTVPLVVVTEPANEASPIPDLAVRLASHLFGVANVVDMDRRTTFGFTEVLGRDMSCFNGGVRLYWPDWWDRDPPHRHPLLLGRRVAISAVHNRDRPEALVASALMARITAAAARRFEYPGRMIAVITQDQRRRLEAEVADRRGTEVARRMDALIAEANKEREMAEFAMSEVTRLEGENLRLQRELTGSKKEVDRLRAKLVAVEHDAEPEAPSPWEIADPIEALERARTDFSPTIVIPDNVEIETGLEGGFWYHVLLALHRLCELERKGQATNKREQLRQLLAEEVGVPGTYKIGDTGLTCAHPQTGERVEVRERVHLRDGQPGETESLYWITIGVEQKSYKYFICKVGRHA